MKKKFKITGTEEAMYQAKVTVTTKGRKNDLPVNNGDIVSIIRTTNCPKGKWLARDSNNTYGYIAVDHVELDIQEMLELGKKAAISSKNSNNVSEPEVASMGSRTSNHYPLSTGSFTDDSEEWTCDDDEPLSPRAETVDPLSPQGHIRTHSMPDMGNHELPINHQHSHSDISAEGPHMQARHEALQKLATFFHSPKPAEQPTASTEAETSPVHVEEAAHPPASDPAPEIDSELPDMLILPPPDLYADIITAE
ncbi:FYN-binding protein 1-like isoform X2 [Myripristis murdjan]|uniref:FYN-binding protein 1-like isoform X2 n=1 Tax=Myripristis murdjan TaxID=586833 RepID=UPI00117623BE|nr:FYN-binding protein 1-like isoform X2 [Myripristis murdjan]